MAANTFLEMTRSLCLYIPQLPIPLAEQFIRDRYRRILERRNWSGLRREAEFLLNAAKDTGTVAVVRGSTSVVGTGTSFAASDVGRQFKTDVGAPIYTITAVAAQTLTLDRPYGNPTNPTAPYRVFSGYVTAPADFLQFLYVVDPVQGWKLRHWIKSTELQAVDPQRTSFGQPYLLADRMFAASGLPQYEAWPYTTSDRTLYYTYISRAADLIQDIDVPIYPIRSDVIVAGALADAARWPGTPDRPNPYFENFRLWQSYEREFEDKMIEIERRDEDIYLTQLEMSPYASFHIAPMSASFIQSHAI